MKGEEQMELTVEKTNQAFNTLYIGNVSFWILIFEAEQIENWDPYLGREGGRAGGRGPGERQADNMNCSCCSANKCKHCNVTREQSQY